MWASTSESFRAASFLQRGPRSLRLFLAGGFGAEFLGERIVGALVPEDADCLAAEVRDEPQEEGERDAEEQTGDDWKVKSSMFAAVNDVAGRFSQAEGQLAPKIKKDTKQG